MKLGLALKEMLHRSNFTQKKIAEAAGYKTVSCITTPILVILECANRSGKGGRRR